MKSVECVDQLGEAEGILFGIIEKIYLQFRILLRVLCMKTHALILAGNFQMQPQLSHSLVNLGQCCSLDPEWCCINYSKINASAMDLLSLLRHRIL